VARAKQLTVTWPEGTPSLRCGIRSIGLLCVCSNESNEALGTTGDRTTVFGATRARASIPSIEPSGSKTNAPGMSGVQKSSASQTRNTGSSVCRITGADSTPSTPPYANRVACNKLGFGARQHPIWFTHIPGGSLWRAHRIASCATIGAMWRALALAVLMYLTLDLSHPNLPGALNFDADRSVDAVARQVRAPSPVVEPLMMPDRAACRVVTPHRLSSTNTPLPVINVVRVDLRPRGHLLSFAPASPDDH
jgi:hypothetical protein